MQVLTIKREDGSTEQVIGNVSRLSKLRIQMNWQRRPRPKQRKKS